MTLEEFVNKALTVPFKEHGRDYEGWDCYGLVYCGFRDIYGIDLPEYLNYSSTRAYAELKALIDSAKTLWDEVKEPAPGDVALFNLSGQPCHVALVVNAREALHAEARLGTFIEPFKGVMWGKRLAGVYRICPMI